MIAALREELSRNVSQLEACRGQVREQIEALTARDSTILELRGLTERIKASHSDEIKVGVCGSDISKSKERLICCFFKGLVTRPDYRGVPLK